MIDVHCHLQFHSFKDDYQEVIKNAFENGITKIINTGTQVSSSQEAVQLADQYEHLYAIVGVHPHHADKPEENWLGALEKLTDHPKVVGIGECGMDYFSYKSNGIVDPKLQRDIFEKQIYLAHKKGLPLQIHQRQAGKDTLEILTAHKQLLQTIPGMFHCFAGDMDFLKKVLDLGFYIGFDGNITYKGLAPGETTSLSDLASYTPLDRIVTETDSPFLTPIPYRGQRNRPEYVRYVAEHIAMLKQLSVEEVVAQTTENTYTIFRRLKR